MREIAQPVVTAERQPLVSFAREQGGGCGRFGALLLRGVSGESCEPDGGIGQSTCVGKPVWRTGSNISHLVTLTAENPEF